jgi:sulfur carrier protein
MALLLTINGSARALDELNPGASLANVVAALGLKSDRVAMERNGEIAPRGDWGSILMVSGDRLEIVHFVGGGTGETGPRPIADAHCT